MKQWVLSLAILALFTVLSGCEKVGFCRPEKWDNTFATARRIDTLKVAQTDTAYEYYQFGIKEGDKLVFKQVYSFRDCPTIADDEGSRMVLFEVPTGTNSFRIEGSLALQQVKALVSYFCECYPAGTVLLKEGFIEGEKINDKRWRVRASVKLSGNDPRTIDIDDTFNGEN